MRLMASRYKYLLFDLVIVQSDKGFYIYICMCIFMLTNFISKSQTSFSLEEKIATFNCFTFLSSSLLNLLAGGASLSAGPQMALGGTGNKGSKGAEPPSVLGSRCRLAARTKVTAGSAAQQLSGKLSPPCHNFSNAALVLPWTPGYSQESSMAVQQLNATSN